MVLFYEKGFHGEAVSKLAVNAHNAMQIAYTQRTFPDATLIFCDSIQACLDAVLSGEVDGTVINALRTELATDNHRYRDLSYVHLVESDSRCFGLAERNTALLLLLNRGLRLIGNSYGIETSYRHMAGLYTYTIWDFIRDNFLPLSFFFLLITASGFALMAYNLRLKNRQVRAQEQYIHHVDSLNRELDALRRKADSANAAKTTFLNHMSHDIRTPMNAIIGYTDIALKREPTPAVEDCLDKIKESSEHLLSLLNDVLDISRIESGKVKINLQPMNLCSTVGDTVAIAQGFIGNRQLNFQVHRNTPPCPYVLGDSVRLREVLINILSNAIKFTNDGGTITFATETLPGQDEHHYLIRFTIADTGIGMSPDFQRTVFDEFSQENAAGARTEYKGTGLGMTIVKRYVDMMGGIITLDSQPGKGSTFVVELPFEKVEACDLSLPEETPTRTSFNGLRVMLAEDNDLNAEIATLQLTEAGMEVTRVSDGHEAIEAFRDHPAGTFQLILMDVMMPVVNGYEATRSIRRMENRPDGGSIPIVAMTANAFAEDVQASLDAGMNAHIAKPLSVQEVMQTIQRVV